MRIYVAEPSIRYIYCLQYKRSRCGRRRCLQHIITFACVVPTHTHSIDIESLLKILCICRFVWMCAFDFVSHIFFLAVRVCVCSFYWSPKSYGSGNRKWIQQKRFLVLVVVVVDFVAVCCRRCHHHHCPRSRCLFISWSCICVYTRCVREKNCVPNNKNNNKQHQQQQKKKVKQFERKFSQSKAQHNQKEDRKIEYPKIKIDCKRRIFAWKRCVKMKSWLWNIMNMD